MTFPLQNVPCSRAGYFSHGFSFRYDSTVGVRQRGQKSLKCKFECRQQLRKGITQAVAKLKDSDGLESVKSELGQMADFLDHSSRLARAALLQVRISG